MSPKCAQDCRCAVQRRRWPPAAGGAPGPRCRPRRPAPPLPAFLRAGPGGPVPGGPGLGPPPGGRWMTSIRSLSAKLRLFCAHSSRLRCVFRVLLPTPSCALCFPKACFLAKRYIESSSAFLVTIQYKFAAFARTIGHIFALNELSVFFCFKNAIAKRGFEISIHGRPGC